MDDRILKFADSKQYLGKIARSGENNTRSLAFDCSSALAEYPTSQIIAVIQRPQGDPYTVTPDADGTIRRITLTAYDLEFNGRLQIELRVLDGDKILKSAIYTATVDDSIRGEADAPGQPVRDVLDRLDAEIKQAQAVVNDIRQKLENGEFNGSDAEVTAENIQTALGYTPVKDVQVAGSSVLDGGVANVPISSPTRLGVIKIGNAQNSGMYVDQDGNCYISYATHPEIDGRTAQRNTVVCSNLDYAVKAAMCDGKGAAWTSAEQKSARDRMGIQTDAELISSITVGSGGAARVYIPFEGQYSKFIVGAQLPIMADGALGFFLDVYIDNNKEYIVGSSYGSASYTYSVRFEMHIENGIVSGQSSGEVPGWGGGQVLGPNSAGTVVTGHTLTWMSLYTPNEGRVIPEGTIIKAYGAKI